MAEINAQWVTSAAITLQHVSLESYTNTSMITTHKMCVCDCASVFTGTGLFFRIINQVSLCCIFSHGSNPPVLVLEHNNIQSSYSLASLVLHQTFLTWLFAIAGLSHAQHIHNSLSLPFLQCIVPSHAWCANLKKLVRDSILESLQKEYLNKTVTAYQQAHNTVRICNNNTSSCMDCNTIGVLRVRTDLCHSRMISLPNWPPIFLEVE